MDPLRHYRDVWAVDFEYHAPPGHRPHPLCLVAREVRTGRLVRSWLADGPPAAPPVGGGPDTLVVAYYAPAELGCYRALGWPPPARVLDLYAEFRNHTNGAPPAHGHGLLGALAHFGVPAPSGAEKDAMRGLAMRGGPYTAGERRALVDYCQSDADATAALLPRMAPHVDLPRALLRGRYAAAVAGMEHTGIPVDADTLGGLRAHWAGIKGRLVGRVDADFGAYVRPPGGGPPAFSAARWGAYLARRGIPWPRLPTGRLALDDDTFRQMSKAYPDAVGPVRELRHALGQLRLTDLAVGPDGRNRCPLSPFGSRTGRNQPSNSRYVFGPSCWLRSLIRPGPGAALAYVDWSQQELAIAAALSGDAGMMAAYVSGYFYLTFAKMAGAAPADATKGTHGAVRDQFEVVSLGVLYGLSADGLAGQLGVPPCRGRELLDMHRRTFPRFWRWSDGVEERAVLTGRVRTCLGWALRVGRDANPRSVRNFPMQASGAEMMRVAACLATERGIAVCGPVHDAFLVEGPAADIDAVVARTQACMREASELVLPGFPLRTDAKVVRFPGRSADPRGVRMWRAVTDILADARRAAGTRAAGGTGPGLTCATGGTGGCATGGRNLCHRWHTRPISSSGFLLCLPHPYRGPRRGRLRPLPAGAGPGGRADRRRPEAAPPPAGGEVLAGAGAVALAAGGGRAAGSGVVGGAVGLADGGREGRAGGAGQPVPAGHPPADRPSGGGGVGGCGAGACRGPARPTAGDVGGESDDPSGDGSESGQ